MHVIFGKEFQMKLPLSYYQNRTSHRLLIPEAENGTLSCGFLFKPDHSYSDTELTFQHYGALLLLDGTGSYSDHNGNRYRLSPGAFIQRIPGLTHNTLVQSSGNWLEFFVCFGKESYETLLHLGLISDVPVIFPGLNPQILEKCVYLLECFENASEEQTPYLYHMSQNFVTDMFYASKKYILNDAERESMAKACELLCRLHPMKKGTEVAQELCLPYELFRKKFKTLYGISPNAYQMQFRINFSKRLLLETRKTIGEIALDCRFSDGFAYSKAFKKRCGVSPLEFRLYHSVTR
jgi:AraC family transcriptional regulator of arabinose operon